MKRILPLLLSFLLVLSLIGCGGRSSTVPAPSPAEAPDYYHGSYEGKNEQSFESPSNPSDNEAEPVDRSKMIYRASINLETLEYDAAMDAIDALVKNSSGYYQEQELSTYSSGYRYARMVIRVPKAHFADFCQQVGNVCHTVRINTSQENISESYYDVESRLNTAKTKLVRLQELLAKAETMADIITIESAIADTELDIDYLSGTLRSYDNLVDYATIYLDLDEVYRFSGTGEAPLTLGQRLGEAFSSGLSAVGDFFESLLLFLAYAWFWVILAIAAVVILIRLIRGKHIFRRKKKKTSSGAANETDA